MKKDKAISKALTNKTLSELPYGFENRVMKAIYLEAEKQNKRRFALSVVLISLVSAMFVGGTIYVLHLFYAIKFPFSLPQLTLGPESKTSLLYSIYIAVIALFLLVLDMYFRKLVQKKS